MSETERQKQVRPLPAHIPDEARRLMARSESAAEYAFRAVNARARAQRAAAQQKDERAAEHFLRGENARARAAHTATPTGGKGGTTLEAVLKADDDEVERLTQDAWRRISVAGIQTGPLWAQLTDQEKASLRYTVTEIYMAGAVSVIAERARSDADAQNPPTPDRAPDPHPCTHEDGHRFAAATAHSMMGVTGDFLYCTRCALALDLHTALAMGMDSVRDADEG